MHAWQWCGNIPFYTVGICLTTTAQLAFLGFCSQAAVRGLGPIDGLKLHLENPGYNNIFTSAVGGEATAAVIALSIAPLAIQVTRALSDKEDDEFRPIPGPW